ncbi:MAG: hypothetical protein ACX939_10710, partial [Hyphococcus sp.]
MRCTSCTESWFVPAPEDLDVAPIEELPSSSRVAKGKNSEKPSRGGARLKVRIEDDEAETEKPRAKSKASAKSAASGKSARRKAAEESDDAVGFDDDEDDSLFDAPLTASKDKAASKSRAADKNTRKDNRGKAAQDDEPVEKGWRKGRQFIVEDDEEEDRRPFFSRKRKSRKDRDDDAVDRAAAAREALRFDDEDEDDADVYDEDAVAFEKDGVRPADRGADL